VAVAEPPPGLGAQPTTEEPPAHEPPIHEPPTGETPAPDSRRDRSSLFAIVAVAGLAVGAVMAVMWMLARAERDDAVAERDAAQAAEAEARADVRSMGDELQVANDGRTVAEAEVDRLTGRVEALRADAEADATRIAELEDDVATLTAEVERLTAENESLRADLDATPETPTPAPATPGTTAEATAPPEFARYLGEVLSSRTGSSRLSAEQSRCFGSEIVDLIGLDAVGAGLHNARTSAANDALVAAMQQAAATCGLDPALVFG
jgi:hypothetical protein